MIIFLFLLAYFLGQILMGEIIGRIFYFKSIFQVGSGNPGARNAGRVFGKVGFILVLLGDILKAILACWLAKHFGMNITQQLLVLLCVILGHMYPILYKFHGGKGVASFLGGLLFISPISTLSLIITFLVLFPFNRSFTISGLIAIFLTPIFLIIVEKNIWAGMVAAIIVIIIILKHRDNR